MKTAIFSATFDQNTVQKAEENAQRIGYASLQDAVIGFVNRLATRRNADEESVLADEDFWAISEAKAKEYKRDVAEMKKMLRERPKEAEKYTARSAQELIAKLMSDD